MRLALFIVLLALPDCTCEREAPPAPRVAGARPANLGGGYQGAKWGTSHDDVKRIAVGKIVRDTPDEIGLGLGRGGVSFHFTNDKLTSVVYTPNFEDDARDRPLLIEALRGKFGAPTTTVQDGEELLV